MSVHTRTRRTKGKFPTSERKNENIHWKEAFTDLFEKYTEAGVSLKGYRLKLEMTQKELAKKLKVTQHRISEWERGKRLISKKMAIKMGDFFDTNYRKFL